MIFKNSKYEEERKAIKSSLDQRVELVVKKYLGGLGSDLSANIIFRSNMGNPENRTWGNSSELIRPRNIDFSQTNPLRNPQAKFLTIPQTNLHTILELGTENLLTNAQADFQRNSQLDASIVFANPFVGYENTKGIEIYLDLQGDGNFLKQIKNPKSNKYELQPIKDDALFDYYRSSNPDRKKLKMLVIVCMYNESIHHFLSTLEGIYQNIKEYNGISPEELAVVVMIDGMYTMSPAVKDLIDRLNVFDSLGNMTRLRKTRSMTFDFQNIFLLHEMMGTLEQSEEIYRAELDEFYKCGIEFLREAFDNYMINQTKYEICIHEILFQLRKLLCFKKSDGGTNNLDINENNYEEEEKKDNENILESQILNPRIIKLYCPEQDPETGRELSELREKDSWKKLIKSIKKIKRLYYDNIEKSEQATANSSGANEQSALQKLRENLTRSRIPVIERYLPTKKAVRNIFYHWIRMSHNLKEMFLNFSKPEVCLFDFKSFLEQENQESKHIIYVQKYFPKPKYSQEQYQTYENHVRNIGRIVHSDIEKTYIYENYLNTLLNEDRCKLGISLMTTIVYELKIRENFFYDNHLSDYIKRRADSSNGNNGNQADPALNIFLAIKVKNKRKLNSHLWFFKGFCNTLKPKYCCLIDCGTVPEKDGIVNFYKEFERDKNIGGLCGAMGARIDNFDSKYNPLKIVARAQVFEYAIGHVMDKNFESLFGFIHVLPGAWSAYRWKALSENFILEKKYLASTKENYQAESINEINMVLAEDRLLCLALFTMARHNYLLKYVSNACAKADAVLCLFEFFNQRRRWINGSWYALDNVLHFKNDVDNSNHSSLRILFFHISLAFSKFNMYVIYVSLSLNLMTVKLALDIRFSQYYILDSPKVSLAGMLYTLYLCVILGIFFVCIQTKPRDIGPTDPLKFSRLMLKFFTIVLGILSVGTYVLMASVIYERQFQFSWDNYVLICLLINFGSYFLLMLLNPYFLRDIINPLNWISYIFFLPTYMISFMLFSFCNIDDHTWGTKNNFQDENRKAEFIKELKDYKVDYVAMWIIINSVVLYILNILNSVESQRNIFIFAITIFFTFNIAFKTFFALIHICCFRAIQLYKFICRK